MSKRSGKNTKFRATDKGNRRKVFRKTSPLRVRGSVWRICSRELQSGFCGNDCTGESPSAFFGQTEWWRVDRQSGGRRLVGFSKRQVETIDLITDSSDFNGKPTAIPFGLPAEPKKSRIYDAYALTKGFCKYGPNGISDSQGDGVTKKQIGQR